MSRNDIERLIMESDDRDEFMEDEFIDWFEANEDDERVEMFNLQVEFDKFWAEQQ